nr:MAG TPA: hypothetical protein [Caudoviricetes sp.]
MDALEFLVERKRLCGSYKGCVGCPFGAAECVVRDMTSENTCKRIIAAVEQWSKEHPRKTRQSVFLEQWPNASVNEYGILFCPKTVNSTHICYCKDKSCTDCRREFWMQEVE